MNGMGKSKIMLELLKDNYVIVCKMCGAPKLVKKYQWDHGMDFFCECGNFKFDKSEVE